MNKPILLTNIMIFIASLFFPLYSAHSQEFLPASERVEIINRATIYGIGGISTGNNKENKSVNPSSKIVLDYNISDRWKVFSLFNIGSGPESSEESTKDSIKFDINSIFFPDEGDLGGKAGISVALWRSFHKKDANNESDNDRLKEIAPFFEWSFQKRNGIVNQENLQFFVTTSKIGLMFTSIEGFSMSNSNFQSLKFMGGVYFTWILITDGSVIDFQKFFGNQNFSDSFKGIGAKIGFQYNSFIYEMELQQAGDRGKGNPENQIIQEKFSVRISAAGVGLALGSMKRNSLKFFKIGN